MLSKSKRFEIHMAAHYGFCAGVSRALSEVKRGMNAAKRCSVLHELVHNHFVVDTLARNGVRTIMHPEEAHGDETVYFSAHGVDRATKAYFREHHIATVDLTCPIVQKMHSHLQTLQGQGVRVLIIGNPHHREILGLCGSTDTVPEVIDSCAAAEQIVFDQRPVAYMVQTTLAPEDFEPIVALLRTRCPTLSCAGSVCYATAERQKAVRDLCAFCDTIIVIGSLQSSNTMRLTEIAQRAGRTVLRLDSADELTETSLSNAHCIGVTAGASTPDEVIAAVMQKLSSF